MRFFYVQKLLLFKHSSIIATHRLFKGLWRKSNTDTCVGVRMRLGVGVIRANVLTATKKLIAQCV